MHRNDFNKKLEIQIYNSRLYTHYTFVLRHIACLSNERYMFVQTGRSYDVSKVRMTFWYFIGTIRLDHYGVHWHSQIKHEPFDENIKEEKVYCIFWSCEINKINSIILIILIVLFLTFFNVVVTMINCRLENRKGGNVLLEFL